MFLPKPLLVFLLILVSRLTISALTDYYAVDPHYGTNEDYVRFVQHAHQKGLKVIHDVVLNHIGSGHYLWLDQPARNWFHQWPTFTRGNYRNGTVNDPRASALDRRLFQHRHL